MRSIADIRIVPMQGKRGGAGQILRALSLGTGGGSRATINRNKKDFLSIFWGFGFTAGGACSSCVIRPGVFRICSVADSRCSSTTAVVTR